jgi:hypothetical protein
MKKNIFLFVFSIGLVTGLSNCESNKIACPSYADSFPQSKSKKPSKVAGIPDGLDNAPVYRHRKKPKSVLPGDGPNGKRIVPH